MAGERIGKTYEALLKVVLDSLQERGSLDGKIFWNETPDRISVEPDFLIGPDINHPSVIMMVTHSGSSKNSDMKCWRNIGELCEAKSVLQPAPAAINIVFDSIMKENLKELQAAAFDGQLIIGDYSFGLELIQWARENEESLPTNQEDKAETIRKLIVRDRRLSHLISLLSKKVSEVVGSHQKDLDVLWFAEKERPHGSAPTAKSTSVRRGLSKLLIFEDITTAIKLYRGGRLKLSDIPEYAYAIGLAKKAIGHPIPLDDEIMGAVGILTDNQIRYVCGTVKNNSTFQSMLRQLRDVSLLEHCRGYIIDQFELLVDRDCLYSRLIQLHDDPDALIQFDNNPKGWPPANVWLFDMALELIKVSTGKANGYGYAQLAADVADINGYANEFDNETRSFLLSPWGHLSEWSSRTDDGSVPREVIKAVASVIAGKLREIGKDGISKLGKELIGSYIHNLLENKICTYRSFVPLASLLVYDGIMPDLESSDRIQTCFAEKASLRGQSGKTTVFKVKHTIINWQTATDAGKDHKRKELCGRAVGLRYSWDKESRSFVMRQGIKKLVLLLDGTWTQEDLNVLVHAGWDEIYYPDEIDKLKAAIV